MLPSIHNCQTHTPHSIHFNEESTNRLLRELKLSVGDISEMIEQSKKSLGIDATTNDNSNKNALSVFDGNTQNECSVNFGLSIEEENEQKSELAYSTSPNAVFRSDHEYLKISDRANTGGIIGKLNFDDDEEIIGKWEKEKKTINQITYDIINNEKNRENFITEIKIVPEQPYKETHNKHNDNIEANENVLNCSEEFDEEKEYQYESEYNIIVNKNSKIFIEKQSKENKIQLQKVQEMLQISKNRKKNSNENTCCQNELENILILKSKAKRAEAQIETEQNISKICKNFKNNLQHEHHRFKKEIITNVISPKTTYLHKNQTKSKSPCFNPKSPSKSPQNEKAKSSLNTQTPIKKKPNFIDKFNPVLGKITPPKTTASKERSYQKQMIEREKDKYSHISKSPQNKKSEALEQKKHLQTTKEQWNRKQFTEEMLKQCYVRRFLTADELNIAFVEFEKKGVPRYQWEEKIIGKIFKKIHQMEEII